MITRNLQIVPKNPNIDDTHLGRWSLDRKLQNQNEEKSFFNKIQFRKKFC